MVNIKWAREAGFITGFFFAIGIIALRTFHIHVDTLAVYALVVLWFCLFGLFYQIAKRLHS